MAFHRTSGEDPDASIGRWRRDMPAHLREPTRAAFGEVLPLLGYTDDA
jgi:hypothetical protein